MRGTLKLLWAVALALCLWPAQAFADVEARCPMIYSGYLAGGQGQTKTACLRFEEVCGQVLCVYAVRLRLNNGKQVTTEIAVPERWWKPATKFIIMSESICSPDGTTADAVSAMIAPK